MKKFIISLFLLLTFASFSSVFASDFWFNFSVIKKDVETKKEVSKRLLFNLSAFYDFFEKNSHDEWKDMILDITKDIKSLDLNDDLDVSLLYTYDFMLVSHYLSNSKDSDPYNLAIIDALSLKLSSLKSNKKRLLYIKKIIKKLDIAIDKISKIKGKNNRVYDLLVFFRYYAFFKENTLIINNFQPDKGYKYFLKLEDKFYIDNKAQETETTQGHSVMRPMHAELQFARWKNTVMKGEYIFMKLKIEWKPEKIEWNFWDWQIKSCLDSKCLLVKHKYSQVWNYNVSAKLYFDNWNSSVTTNWIVFVSP